MNRLRLVMKLIEEVQRATHSDVLERCKMQISPILYIFMHAGFLVAASACKVLTHV